MAGEHELPRRRRVLVRNDVRERFLAVRRRICERVFGDGPFQIGHQIFNVLENQENNKMKLLIGSINGGIYMYDNMTQQMNNKACLLH